MAALGNGRNISGDGRALAATPPAIGSAGKAGKADRWPLSLHAIVMLTAAVVAVMSHSAWPMAVGLGASFSGLVASWAGHWTASGRLGLANALTLLRVLLLVAALAPLPGWSPDRAFAALAVAFALDAVDGFVARRFGCVSDFGAMLDAETDAALIAALGLTLWLRGLIGPWVLLPGSLRYLYLLSLALFPPRPSGPWRSRFGRLVFLGSSAFLFLAAWRPPGLLASLCAALATVGLGVSFGRSLLAAYPLARRAWRLLGPTLGFVAAWSFLDVVVNVRYPAYEPLGWYFVPSLDATVVLAALALVGLTGWRLPGWARWPLVVAFFLARALRIGDGVTRDFFGKDFNVYTDLPLTPELVRYAHSTYPAWRFWGGVLLALVLVAALVLAIDRALRFATAYLGRRRHALVFAALALPFVAVSFFLHQDPRYEDRYAGAFGASIAPRFQHEITFLLNVYDHRQSGMRAIGEVQQVLRHTPAGLERLHHANVYVIFIESYGAIVLDRPGFAAEAVPALEQVQASLGAHGFHAASARMVSPTYGGMSWLAHATLLTGVRATDQLEYDLLGVARPKSLARIAHEAGYHTVLVQPNTNRRSHTADFYDFDETVKNWDFDYAGPAFAWAAMPDQYVLDYVRRQVIARRPGPLFLLYNLVSSHAPWSHVPTMVEDWSAIGNGQIYNTHPLKRAYVNWPGFQNAAGPYLRSILYDWQVLDDYLSKFVTDDSLFVILGDHQPISEVTLDSPSWAVPVHVLSRDALLVEPFVKRGYAPGMVPTKEVAPMESFMVELLRAFSAEPGEDHAS